MGHLADRDTVGDFGVEAGRGAYDCYGGVGVEAVEDASGCDLKREKEDEESGAFDGLGVVTRQNFGGRGGGGSRTSPPPTTSTFLALICQARMRLPPPWTSGNWFFSEPMLPSEPPQGLGIVLLVC